MPLSLTHRRFTRAAAALAVVLGTGLVHAGPTDSQRRIPDAPVGCTLESQQLELGAIGSAGPTARGQASTIRVQCPRGTRFRIALSGGLDASSGARHLQHREGLGSLAYRLYQDSSFSLEWGDARVGDSYPGGRALRGIGTGRLQEFAVHVRLASTQTASPGAYVESM